jgi:hypothetical protein
MRLLYGTHRPTEQANLNLLTLSKDSNPYPGHAPPGSTEALSAPSRVRTGIHQYNDLLGQASYYD